jgi:hypothetical protein
VKRIVWLCLPLLLFACQTAGINGNGHSVTVAATIVGARAAGREEFRTFYQGAALFDWVPSASPQIATVTVDLRSFAFRE